MNLLICGSRNWTDYEKVEKAVLALKPKVTRIVIGDARGADTIGKKVATKLGIYWYQYLAEWEKYGRSAGPIRNKKMLVEQKPFLVLAFTNDLERSKGTKNTVELAKKMGIPVMVLGSMEANP